MAVSRLSIIKFLELPRRRRQSNIEKTITKFEEYNGIDISPAGIDINHVVIVFVIALTCSCVALHYHSYNADADLGMLVTGTFIGYLIIFAGAAAGYIMQTPTHKRIDIFYSLVGVGLFIASGALIIDRFQHYSKNDFRDKNLAKASLAIINGAILLLDAVLTQRGG